MYTEACVTCDGEALMLDKVFINEVVSEFRDNEIVVGKLPASTSGIYQPLDVSKVFMAAKTRLETIVNNEEDVSNPTVQKLIKDRLTEFGVSIMLL
jgi:hypothetical protein